MGHAHNAEYASTRKSKDSLRHLVTHIHNSSLTDDVVCKLSVPRSDTPGTMLEIEVAISDVIVMLAMAGQNYELTSSINDMLDEVQRNSISQSSITAGLNSLRGHVNKTFSPTRITQQIVADITRLPK